MSDDSPSSTEALHDFMEEEIKIDGLENAAREKDLGTALQSLDGVRNVTVSSGTVSVTYDPTAISAKEIHARIRQEGFTPGEREIAPSAPPIP